MKNTIALLLLITLAFTACKDNTKNKADDEAKKAQQLAEQQRKEIETKSYEVVKARLMRTTFKDSILTLDTLIIKEIDSATEKTARQNYCALLLNVKEATDYYVEQQGNVVKSAEAVSPMLAEPEKVKLQQAIIKQEVANANYEECLKSMNEADALNYQYHQVTVETISTRTMGKNITTDTTQQKFYLDKNNYEIKLF